MVVQSSKENKTENLTVNKISQPVSSSVIIEDQKRELVHSKPRPWYMVVIGLIVDFILS